MNSDCNACKKRILRVFLLTLSGLNIAEIAESVHVSKGLVYKHFQGTRNCPSVDAFLAGYLFNIIKGDGT